MWEAGAAPLVESTPLRSESNHTKKGTVQLQQRGPNAINVASRGFRKFLKNWFEHFNVSDYKMSVFCFEHHNCGKSLSFMFSLRQILVASE